LNVFRIYTRHHNIFTTVPVQITERRRAAITECRRPIDYGFRSLLERTDSTKGAIDLVT